PQCPMCGDKPSITKLIDYEQFCGIRGEETPAYATTNQMSETTVQDLKRRLDARENVFVLDVRNPEEYQICRIPGSVMIPLPQLGQRLGELDRDREIIVHCKSGMRSLKAQQLLRDKGFTKIINLKGGILAW